MAEETLADTILTMIRSEANNNPPPLDARIFRVYNSDYVDVECNGRIFKSVRCIGIKTVGNEGLLVFIDGDLNNQVFITSENVYGKDEVYTKEEVDELIEEGGGGDMSDYVKKADVSFTVDLLDNGCMSFELTY